MRGPRRLLYHNLILAIEIAVAIGLLAYSAMRASQLAMTVDEAITTFLHVTKPFDKILLLETTTDPIALNNHVLNSLGIKLFDVLGGRSEFWVRLPTLIAHAIFLTSTLSISRRLDRGVFGLASFLLVNSNPYALEFFALARGYGLAMGFEAASIGLLSAYIARSNSRWLQFAGCTAAAMCVFSHLTMLYFYLAFIGCMSIAAAVGLIRLRLMGPWFRFPFRLAARLWPMACSMALTVPMMIVHFKKLNRYHDADLMTAGHVGIWHDTVCSLLNETTIRVSIAHTVSPQDQELMILMIMGIAILLFPIRAIYDRGKPSSLTPLLVTMLLVACLTGQWAAHAFLDRAYWQSRTTMSLIPLFLLVFVYVLDSIRKMAPKTGTFVALLLALPAMESTVGGMNLKHVHAWGHDADTRRMVNDLTTLHWRYHPNAHVTIGGSWWLMASIEYYRSYYRLNWLTVAFTEPASPPDYYYISPVESGRARTGGFTPVIHYPETDNVLAAHHAH